MSRWCGSSSIIPGELWTDRDYSPWNSFQGSKKLKSSGGRGRYKQPSWRHPKQAEIWPLTSWRAIIFISPSSQRSRWLWVSRLWKRVARRLMTCLERSFYCSAFSPFQSFRVLTEARFTIPFMWQFEAKQVTPGLKIIRYCIVLQQQQHSSAQSEKNLLVK